MTNGDYFGLVRTKNIHFLKMLKSRKVFLILMPDDEMVTVFDFYFTGNDELTVWDRTYEEEREHSDHSHIVNPSKTELTATGDMEMTCKISTSVHNPDTSCMDTTLVADENNPAAADMSIMEMTCHRAAVPGARQIMSSMDMTCMSTKGMDMTCMSTKGMDMTTCQQASMSVTETNWRRGRQNVTSMDMTCMISKGMDMTTCQPAREDALETTTMEMTCQVAKVATTEEEDSIEEGVPDMNTTYFHDMDTSDVEMPVEASTKFIPDDDDVVGPVKMSHPLFSKSSSSSEKKFQISPFSSEDSFFEYKNPSSAFLQELTKKSQPDNDKVVESSASTSGRKRTHESAVKSDVSAMEMTLLPSRTIPFEEPTEQIELDVPSAHCARQISHNKPQKKSVADTEKTTYFSNMDMTCMVSRTMTSQDMKETDEDHKFKHVESNDKTTYFSNMDMTCQSTRTAPLPDQGSTQDDKLHQSSANDAPEICYVESEKATNMDMTCMVSKTMSQDKEESEDNQQTRTTSRQVESDNKTTYFSNMDMTCQPTRTVPMPYQNSTQNYEHHQTTANKVPEKSFVDSEKTTYFSNMDMTCMVSKTMMSQNLKETEDPHSRSRSRNKESEDKTTYLSNMDMTCQTSRVIFGGSVSENTARRQVADGPAIDSGTQTMCQMTNSPEVPQKSDFKSMDIKSQVHTNCFYTR